MLDWAPTKRGRAVAQHGGVSEETEAQADSWTMLGDVADSSELALAEREQWSGQLRWLDEFRDSLQARDTMTLDGHRWRKKLPFLFKFNFKFKCLKVARFLRQCSNIGTVAE